MGEDKSRAWTKWCGHEVRQMAMAINEMGGFGSGGLESRKDGIEWIGIGWPTIDKAVGWKYDQVGKDESSVRVP